MPKLSKLSKLLSCNRSACLWSPLAVALVLFGCADNKHTDAPITAGKTATLTANADGQLVVATVNGQPIYDTCVTRELVSARDQSENSQDEAETDETDSIQSALNRCIDFEVFAQEGKARGLDRDADVAQTSRTESVRRLLDTAFYQRFAKPEDVPMDDVKNIWDRGLKDFFVHTEHRDTFYCRATNPKKGSKYTPKEGDANENARLVAFEMHKRLTAAMPLDAVKMKTICQEVVKEMGTAELISSLYGAPLGGRAVREWEEVVFAIPKVGMLSPPSRSRWGWDISLLREIKPARNESFEQATPEIREMLYNGKNFEGYRRQYFSRFLARHQQKFTIKRFDERIPYRKPVLVGAKVGAKPKATPKKP